MDPNTYIDVQDCRLVTGVTFSQFSTLGSTRLRVFGQEVTFHVTEGPLPLPVDGIIGVKFLRRMKAEISFHYNTILTECQPLRPIPFLNFIHSQDVPSNHNITRENTVLRIEARSRKVIPIPVINHELSEGYLPQLDAGEGLLIGNAAVSVENGFCHAMAINTTPSEICVQISPQEIIPCDIDLSESSEPDDFLFAPPQPNKLSKAERVKLINGKIGTNHLNPEQNSHVQEIISEFPNLFLLPGDESHLRIKKRSRIK